MAFLISKITDYDRTIKLIDPMLVPEVEEAAEVVKEGIRGGGFSK